MGEPLGLAISAGYVHVAVTEEVAVQRPAEQVSPGTQTFPQDPQFELSDTISTQADPHIILGDEHVVEVMHVPPVHKTPAPHARPQPPQFAASLFVSVQRPPHSV